ncbi:helix-turn-helix domain-containing protein [uncultured Robinsoniella sp.]|uniref:AraC family transcriptional regulator n=1 Tax=uncultured Robinsoniella sp. TaxID=904190 RepID=UPI00374E80F7
MENNRYEIGRVIDYIEDHLLDEKLDLEAIATNIGYSKYHLHRMFTAVVGFTVHRYIQRRRLTEAARMLIFTDKPIIEIALCAGYETQRSFSKGFKAMFQFSPKSFRKHSSFLPLQLKFDVKNCKKLRGDRIVEVKNVEAGTITVVGCRKSTKKGFIVIGKCWNFLHGKKHKIKNRTDPDFLIGINDYSMFRYNEEDDANPAFNYIAGAQVSVAKEIPKGMDVFILPASKYVVFTFRGRNDDSLQPIVEYIYQEWFPEAACQFNENNPYDFVKYGEITDRNGESEIQFWVPVI